MEISGKLGVESSDNISGAFYKSGSGVNLQSDWYNRATTMFKASRNWTGATSSNGTHTHTLSNNVLGKSNTVQPPSMKVRVKTRYK